MLTITKTSILPKLIFKLKPIKKKKSTPVECEAEPKIHKELSTKNSKTFEKEKEKKGP